jgi:synaptojanin
LSSGTFYFAYSLDFSKCTFDLTLSSQARYLGRPTNKKYLWNYSIHIPFRRLGVDTDLWLLKMICGCVEIKKIVILSRTYKTCIFSRLSCERVGTRFNCRGINDEGNCANFVETEQVIYSLDTNEESSFVQLRGSAPVFFEQTGLQVGSHKLKITRGLESCYPAFERHIKTVLYDYGKRLLVLNLLGKKGDEEILTNMYANLCNNSPFSMNHQLVIENFDYHHEMKIYKGALTETVWPMITKFNNTMDETFFYLKMDSESNKTSARLQNKFIRTNCMDCLDRTNNSQLFIGIEMLRYQLKDIIQYENELNKFRDIFRQMWIINGDCISKIYAGTGAIQGRSMTTDLTRSITRTIQNNFLDNTKQDAIETFLHNQSRNYGEIADRIRILMSQNFLRLPYNVLREMINQYKEYTRTETCIVSINTWNINGGLTYEDMKNLNLKEWLVDGPSNAQETGIGYLNPSKQQKTFQIQKVSI